MKIDYNRDELIGEFAKQTLRDRYMLPEERSPQDAYARAAKAFADDEAHAQRIYDYASQQWFMFPSHDLRKKSILGKDLCNTFTTIINIV